MKPKPDPPSSSVRRAAQIRRLGTGVEPLPLPDHPDLERAAELEALLRREIRLLGGSIPFQRYMELALYAPGLGYYSAGLRGLGEAGDFITAPELSPLFGRCMARQCGQVLNALEGGDVLEFGAGSGVMAAEVLAELERLGVTPANYYILEVSDRLRHQQRQTLAQRVPELMAQVSWITEPPDAGVRGVILANEVLDAMPVRRVRIGPDYFREWHVGWTPGGFNWRTVAADPRLGQRLDGLRRELSSEAPWPYDTEIGEIQEAWMRQLGAYLRAGCALVIDYGFPHHEYYHPQRREGTLMCHYRHRAHADPLVLTGLQDITAHVDFTALAEAALASGLSVSGYTSQAHFLFNTGLAESAGTAAEPARMLRLSGEVKRLTLPEEMGELFKVLALTRDIDVPLMGFAAGDRRHRL